MYLITIMSQFVIKRLQKEYSNIIKSNNTLIYAKPLEANIFIWNYILIGNQEPYNNGYYHGTLTFSSEYPIKPPSINMFTPNGRFETNTPFDIYNSGFPNNNWEPSRSIERVLYDLYNYMLDKVNSVGDINNQLQQRKKYAIESYNFNKTNPVFMDILEEMNCNKSVQYNIIDKYKIFL